MFPLCAVKTTARGCEVLPQAYQKHARGRPRAQDYRHMNGSSVHTYTLVNASNAATFVKFHWVPTVGARAAGLLVPGIGFGC